jgi:hypothetical protein
VGGDEVLQHRQAFTEVRLDRALDDLADAAVSFFCGLAIRPRIPASCRIWSRLPRLPESNIMNTG